MSDFDLGETAATVLDSRRLTSPNAVLDVVGGTVLVLADRDRIIQVIGNLIDNALHATDGAGTITVTVGQNDGTAVLDVTDNGPGVPNADRERIFERLVRIDDARTNHRGGAGLGLPIARGIARAHHGELNALEPTLGKGAQFRLTLPAAGKSASGDDLDDLAKYAARTPMDIA